MKVLKWFVCVCTHRALLNRSRHHHFFSFCKYNFFPRQLVFFASIKRKSDGCELKFHDEKSEMHLRTARNGVKLQLDKIGYRHRTNQSVFIFRRSDFFEYFHFFITKNRWKEIENGMQTENLSVLLSFIIIIITIERKSRTKAVVKKQRLREKTSE